MAKNVIYLISFLICSIVTQAQTTAWYGTAATKIVNAGNGTGTEDNPIEIASASELAYLAQQTNAGGKELTLENGGTINGKTNFQGVYFKLTEDIDLGEQAWTPIGKNDSYPFKGVFDGNEKTISNMAAINTNDYNYAGLFGFIANGSILNLQIEIAATGLHVQGVVNIGTLVGHITNSIITNCHVKGGNIIGDSPIFTQMAVGGLIGQMASSEVTGCSSAISVTATHNGATTLCAGGIIGINTKSSITNCQYSGSVMAIDERVSGTPNSYTGGITGASDLLPVGAAPRTSTISGCTANVNISAGAYAGGIVGYFTEGDVEKCTVKGVIDTKETGGQAGGIMGYNRWGGSVTDCYNTSSVTSLNTAGGIVGCEYTTYLFTISKCWSSGDITAPTAGGIVGQVGFGIIEECYASGNITGKASTESYAGGIAGYAASETIKNCASTANVTAEREGEKQAFAGGIVGVGLKSSYSPKSTSIQNCYATGKITSNFVAGGIAGLNQGEGSIINCIALNKEGIGEITESQSLLKSTTGVYGRITAEKQGTLTSNFASPLIPGNWSNEATGKDGDDLTSDNFTKDAGNAFDQWDDTNVWSFDPSGTNLPVLKAFGENTGGSQPEKPIQPNIPKSEFLAFTLTYDTPQNGTITVSSPTRNSIPAGSSISGGMVLTITATPNTGYNLASLKVNDTDFTSGDTYIVNSDVKVEATFSKIPEPEPEPNPEPGPGPDYPITYYSVMLPQVEGITTDPEAGEYKVESWSSFRFYLTLAPEYDQSTPIVTTDRGETITPRTSDGAYLIKYVRSNVEIFIDGVVKNTGSVANGSVEADGINIRASKGILDIHVPQPETVSVYSFSGLLLHSRELVAGDTHLPMPSGTYIVKVGDKVVKVMF